MACDVIYAAMIVLGCGVPSLLRKVRGKLPVHVSADVVLNHSVLLGQASCMILFSPLFTDEVVCNFAL